MSRKKLVEPLFRQLLGQCDALKVKLPLYVGDQVQVVSGEADIGKRGKIISIDPKEGTATIEGVNMKARRVSKFVAATKVVEIPEPLPITSLRLVDSITDRPTKVKVYKNDQGELIRESLESGQVLPKPPKQIESKQDGPLDTDVETVEQVTFQPALDIDPLPAKLWNQIHKLRRLNMEGRAI